MTTQNIRNKTSFINLVKTLIAAINSELPNVQSFVLIGKTVARATLLALLQSLVDADTTTVSTNTGWRTAVNAESAIKEEVVPIVQALTVFLRQQYGKGSPQLLKFGIEPTQPPTTTVAKKMVGVAKGAATRALRNPLTKKEKKELKGVVGPTVAVPTGEPQPAAAGATVVAQSAPARPGGPSSSST